MRSSKKKRKTRKKETTEDMLPNIMNTLSEAIRDKRCVAIRYHDQREVRVIEPHAIYTDERGQLVVDGFQTRGFSASGRPVPFWRPFRLKRIAAVSVLKEKFEPRTTEGFSPDRLKYKNGVIAIVPDSAPTFNYPANATTVEMGPFLPNPTRR
jgi:predicted DNA-binding transcriptional regulator YafY